VKIDEEQQKIKIVRTNRRSNLPRFLPINFLPLSAPPYIYTIKSHTLAWNRPRPNHKI